MLGSKKCFCIKPKCYISPLRFTNCEVFKVHRFSRLCKLYWREKRTSFVTHDCLHLSFISEVVIYLTLVRYENEHSLLIWGWTEVIFKTLVIRNRYVFIVTVSHSHSLPTSAFHERSFGYTLIAISHL